jgi:AcrR family transcriptional regulator
MAWDTERTRALLLNAAAQEFSAHGFAGARVDRIAEAAGVNKERIYSYFGNKERLSAAVLEHCLTAVVDAVPIRGEGIDAITDYVSRLFDYHREHPMLARLIVWEGLERGAPIAEQRRAQFSASKVEALREAVPGLGLDDARELLLTIVTLCDGYAVLPNVERLYFAEAADDPLRVERRKAALVAAVRVVAESLLERVR